MTLLGLGLALEGWSQTLQITHGPFVGGVSQSTARLYVRTSPAGPIQLRWAMDSAQVAAATPLNAQTVAIDDSTAIVDFPASLSANTRYFYQVFDDQGTSLSAVQSFRTLPAPGSTAPLVFTFGSCQKWGDTDTTGQLEPIFAEMVRHDPLLFIQCGDWGYPDTTDSNAGQDFFPEQYWRVQQSYRARYASASLPTLWRQTALDYIWDDHDYANDNSSRNSSQTYGSFPFVEKPFPPGMRSNAIRGYAQHFPHYPLPDTSEGLYHSIRMGEVEIFVCDNRAARSPNNAVLSVVPGTQIYEYVEPAGHSMLGAQQLDWLLRGLQNSTATWKFVVTGVAFNKAFRRLRDFLSGNATFQNLSFAGAGNGRTALGGLMDTWAGFETEQDSILSFCQQNDVRNVIWLSSDSHTSAMDDGQNAGFPELMAGVIHQTNSRQAYLLWQLGFGAGQDFNFWNQGGQGFGNNNFGNAFGKIEVFGPDSVRLSIIDTVGVVLAQMTLCDTLGFACPLPLDTIPTDTIPTDTIPDSRAKPLSPGERFLAGPNPTNDIVTVQVAFSPAELHDAELHLMDITGRILQAWPGSALQGGSLPISLGHLPAGPYYLRLHTPHGFYTRSVWKP